MSLKTRYNLYKAKKSLTPDGHFKASLLKQLNTVWDNTYNTKYAWYQTVFFKHATGFATMVLMAGSLGTGAYAYTSPAVTQDSLLYPLKEKLENIEEKIQITPEAKAKFYLKKIERREVERAKLQSEEMLPAVRTSTRPVKADGPKEVKEKNRIKAVEVKIKKTEKLIERTEDQLEQVGKMIEKIDSKDIKLRKQVKERLKIRAEKRLERLEKIQSSSRRVHQESD